MNNQSELPSDPGRLITPEQTRQMLAIVQANLVKEALTHHEKLAPTYTPLDENNPQVQTA